MHSILSNDKEYRRNLLEIHLIYKIYTTWHTEIWKGVKPLYLEQIQLKKRGGGENATKFRLYLSGVYKQRIMGHATNYFFNLIVK